MNMHMNNIKLLKRVEFYRGKRIKKTNDLPYRGVFHLGNKWEGVRHNEEYRFFLHSNNPQSGKNPTTQNQLLTFTQKIQSFKFTDERDHSNMWMEKFSSYKQSQKRKHSVRPKENKRPLWSRIQGKSCKIKGFI